MQKVVEKMKASGRFRPITDDEYARLKMEQTRKLMENEKANYVPDYSRIGLRESEINMTWDLINPGISDRKKALDAVQPAYMRGHGMVFLWGNYGQAKTMIGKILTATAFRDGKRAAYANMSSVLDDIRLAFDEKENKSTELIRRIDWWVSRDILFVESNSV